MPAGLISSKMVLFIKGQNGLYTNDLETKFSTEITVTAPYGKAQDDLVVEHPCPKSIQISEIIENGQPLNGMFPGNITKALNGEYLGTSTYNKREDNCLNFFLDGIQMVKRSCLISRSTRIPTRNPAARFDARVMPTISRMMKKSLRW